MLKHQLSSYQRGYTQYNTEPPTTEWGFFLEEDLNSHFYLLLGSMQVDEFRIDLLKYIAIMDISTMSVLPKSKGKN
jgi:hypothetical protein